MKRIVLAIACLLLFSGFLNSELVWDDIPLIADNTYIRDYQNIPLFFTPRYWNDLHPYAGHFRPLRTATLAVDYFFWGLNPVGYRITNMVLHILNVLLVFYFVSLFKTGAPDRHGAGRIDAHGFLGLAFLTALFFAVHPVHTESINLVKNRSDLLAFFFFISSLVLFNKHASLSGGMSRVLLIGSWGLFVPAVLAKEMALTLPGVLALYVICFPIGLERKKAFGRILPYAVIIAAYFWFKITFIEAAGPLPTNTPLPVGAGQQVLTVMKTVGIYLKMLLVPFPLVAEHAFTVPGSVLNPAILFALVALLLMSIAAAGMYQRARIVLFALGWIMLTLVPAANLVYLASRPIAEQRLYIPSLGFCLLLGYAVLHLHRIRAARLKPESATAVAVILSIVIVGLYAGLTVHRNLDWRDEMTFYRRSLDANPESTRMHNNLGIVLNRAGRFNAAIDHYLTALRLDPANVNAHVNLGMAYCNTGRYTAAAHHFQAGLMLRPDKDDRRYAGVYNNLGTVMVKLGRSDEGLALFRKVLKMDPGNTDAAYNLGVVLMTRGDYGGALVWFSRVLERDPAHQAAGREYQYCLKMISSARGAAKAE